MKFISDSQKRVEGKVARSAFFAAVDSIVDTHSAITVLAITVSAEVGGLAMIFFARDKFNEYLDSQGNFWIYAAMAIFLIGFFTAFATLRLFWRSLQPFTIWLTSILVGGANLFLFFGILTLRLR